MLRPGLHATVEQTVSEEHTAPSLGTGDVPVCATPALAALVERAAVAALEGSLDELRTTVGARLELDHSAPSPVGTVVTATARLEHVEGRRLRFAVDVTDPAGTVAHGTHVRVVVDRARFMDGARART